MHKISEQAANALLNGEHYKSPNTNVYLGNKANIFTLELFENQIATFNASKQTLTVTLPLEKPEWFSGTTQKRLNALLQVAGIPYKFTRVTEGNKWFIKNLETGDIKPWKGVKTFIVEGVQS